MVSSKIFTDTFSMCLMTTIRVQLNSRNLCSRSLSLLVAVLKKDSIGLFDYMISVSRKIFDYQESLNEYDGPSCLKDGEITNNLDHNNVITRQEILTVVRSIFDMVGPNASESLGDDTPEERVERVFGLMARVSFIQGSVSRLFMGRSNLRSSGKILIWRIFGDGIAEFCPFKANFRVLGL